MSDAMKDVIEHMGAVLVQLLDAGFELPLHVAAISVNGSFATLTYSADPDGHGLAASMHGMHGRDFHTPVNVMLTDSRGEAARVVINGRTSPI